MAGISLRAYVEYIEDRLARGAYTEVIAQCRHILELFPKYVEVYKLLARALMEQESYQDALDLFQRVLSADPSDFTAHVGMSDCYRESGAIDQAIWHLERAYEQAPSNIELQQAIKDLYAEKGKATPRKIQLTGGALARLYINGKLYPQAILELKKALTGDPERLDLQILLAEALWHNRQIVEAGKMAAEILKRLPNSISANRVLAQLWLQAGQPAEAQPFLELVKELDPYQAYEIEHRGQRAPADAFRLVMLEYSPAQHVADAGAADWVSEIASIGKEKGVTGPLQEPAAESAASGPPPPSPSWLDEILGTGAAQPPSAVGAAEPSVDMGELFGTPAVGRMTEEVPAAEPGSAPDWLSDIGAEPIAEMPSVGPPGSPDWLHEVLGDNVAPPAAEAPGDSSAPDWLRDVLGTGAAPPAAAAAPSGPESPVDSGPPDWLRETLGGPVGPAGVPEPPVAPASSEVPDWLKDVISEPETTASAAAPAAGEGREVPDWLGEILAGEPEPVAPATIGEQPATPGVVSDDWLDQLLSGSVAPEAEPAGLAGAPSSAPPEAVGTAVPDWLSGLEAGASMSAVEAAAPSPSFDDLGDLEPWDVPSPSAPREVWPTAPTPGATPLEPDRGTAGARFEEVKSEIVQEAPQLELQGESVATRDRPPAFREGEHVAQPTDESTGDGAQEIPDWLAEGDLDSDSAIAWLEEIAAKYDPNFQGAAPAVPAEPPARGTEEPPVAAAPEAEQEELPDWLKASVPAETAAQAAPPSAEPEELPDWLKAAPPEVPVSRAPSLAAEREEEELPEWLREPTEVVAKPAPTPEAGEGLPDWLRPAPTAEPTPAVAAADRAMAWLDEQIAAQGVSPEKVVSESLTPDQPPSPAVAPPDLSAEAEPVSADELPEWLREAGGQEQIARALEAPGEEGFGLSLEEVEVKEEELSWLDTALEAETATVGAPGGVKAEEELPDWLKGEEKPVAPPMPVAGPAVEAEEEELPDWLKGVEEPAAPPTPVPALAAEAEMVQEEEELPDWLKGEEKPAAPRAPVAAPAAPAAATPGLTDWLKAPPPPPPVAPREPATVEARPAPPTAPKPAPIPEQIAGDFHEQLRIAREKVSAKQVEEALPYYENLIGHRQMVDQTIADLRYVLRSGAKADPRVYRVLGDALRTGGQLQEALEAYRSALDQM